MNSKRIWISVICALCCADAFPYSFTANDVNGNAIYYNTDGDNVSVTYKNTKYKSYSGNIVIPSIVTNGSDAYAVTAIGTRAFYNCSTMVSIVVPPTITSIGSGAFYYCSSLEFFSIPEGVTTIAEGAFQYCSNLDTIVIPNTVTSIQGSAFSSDYNLRTVYCLATTPPSLSGSPFSAMPSTCILYVPASSVSSYEAISEYSTRFAEIRGIGIGASKVDSVTSTSVAIKWEPDTLVNRYDINVYKGTIHIAHFVTDSLGNVTFSHRYHMPISHQKKDTTTSSADYFVIKVGDLEAATDYNYTIKGTNSSQQAIYFEAGYFHTAKDIPLDYEPLNADDPRRTRKVLRDGRMLLLRGEDMYTIQGTKVR